MTAKHHLHEARSIVCAHGLEILQNGRLIRSYIVATRDFFNQGLGKNYKMQALYENTCEDKHKTDKTLIKPPRLKRCQRLCTSETWDTGQSMQLLPSRNCPSAYSSVQSETSSKGPGHDFHCQTNRRSVELQDANTCKHILTGIIAILIYFLTIFPDCLYWFFFVFHPSSGCDIEKMTWKFNRFSIEFYHNSHKQSGPSRKWAWNARVVNPHESWVSDCTKKRLALKAICGHKNTSGVNIETIEHDSTSCETRWHAWNTYMETSSNDWRRGLAPCPSTLHVSSLPAIWPCL